MRKMWLLKIGCKFSTATSLSSMTPVLYQKVEEFLDKICQNFTVNIFKENFQRFIASHPAKFTSSKLFGEH